MAITTSTITFDFTKTNPTKRWQFEPNGANSYFFNDNTITGPTAQTVADGSLFKISRSDDQYDGLTEGNGAYIYTVASINELLGITSQNTFVRTIVMIPFFNTKTNYAGMNLANNVFSGEAGRWISTKTGWSTMYKGRIRFIDWGNNYYITGYPGSTNNVGTVWANFSETLDQDLVNSDSSVYAGPGYSSIFEDGVYDSGSHETIYNDLYLDGGGLNGGVTGQYKYLNFSPGPNGGGLEVQPLGTYWDYPLLTSEKVRFEIPFALTIPRFQHVWTDWPWNKTRKTLTTDLIFTKIEFRITYDTISEYKTKFFADNANFFGGTSSGVYLDREKTRPVPEGYLATNSKYFIINGSGTSIGKRTCQTKILVSTSANGSVSSTYPSTVSGYGDYDFNPDVSYITLDASPDYPIVFDSWQATDFDDIVSTISYDSTINVYNGLYASIKPIFTNPGPSPTPAPTPAPTPGPTPSPEYDYYTADVFACGDCSASTESIVVAFAAGTPVTPGRFYISASGPDGNAYRIDSSTSAPGTAYLLTNSYGSYTSCNFACFV